MVSAGYFREDAQAPVSSFTYTRDEIRRTPGATGDIFRAMETLPCVSPKENIILIDNISFIGMLSSPDTLPSYSQSI